MAALERLGVTQLAYLISLIDKFDAPAKLVDMVAYTHFAEEVYHGALRHAHFRLALVHFSVYDVDTELNRMGIKDKGYGRTLEDAHREMPRAEHVGDECWIREQTDMNVVIREIQLAAEERQIMEGSLGNLNQVLENVLAAKRMDAAGFVPTVVDREKLGSPQTRAERYRIARRGRGRGHGRGRGGGGQGRGQAMSTLRAYTAGGTGSPTPVGRWDSRRGGYQHPLLDGIRDQ